MYDLLKFNADLHTRAGRYTKLNLACPRFNRETEGGKTFSVSATRLWNQLPINLKKKATTVASCILIDMLTSFIILEYILIPITVLLGSWATS